MASTSMWPSTDRYGSTPGESVGHDQVGLERLAGQPAPDHGDGADGVAQPLAVAPERLGHRHHAHLGPGHPARCGHLGLVAHVTLPSLV